MIGDDVVVEVIEVSGSSVRIGIAAPKSVPVYREEIYTAVKEENTAAAAADPAATAGRPPAVEEPLAPCDTPPRRNPDMSLRINSNVERCKRTASSETTSNASRKSMEKLSSGYRINSAADDAAGLGISEKMRGQIRGLAQAQRTSRTASALVQTAEGNLDEVHSMLQRIRELAVQYANGTTRPSGQSSIEAEVNALQSEIDAHRHVGAKFNGISLLNSGAR